MKQIFTGLLICLCLQQAVWAQIAPENISMTLLQGKFTLNKKVLTPDWSLATGQQVLGSASRDRTGFNITHTYDEAGVVLFESASDKVGSGIIIELQVYFSAPDEQNAVVPSGVYTGKFTLENTAMDRHVPMDDMRKKLLAAKYTESESYTEHNYRFALNGIYIYLLYDEDETRLIKISVGKDKTKVSD